MTFTLKVEKREGKIKDEELCMGVVTGAKLESTSLKFSRKDFLKLFAEAGFTNIITLEGLGEPVEGTIQHLDRAPVTGAIRHVDFYALERGVEMNAEVPLVQVNEAPAANLQAIINQVVRSVSITCRPKDLIQELEVDMSLLKDYGDTISIKDLKVPSGVTISQDPETVIISVTQSQEEKKEEVAESADAVEEEKEEAVDSEEEK